MCKRFMRVLARSRQCTQVGLLPEVDSHVFMKYAPKAQISLPLLVVLFVGTFNCFERVVSREEESNHVAVFMCNRGKRS